MTAGSNAVALVGQEEDGIRSLPMVPTAQKLALSLPSLDELKVLEAYGKMFAESGLFPQVQTWQAAAAIIQYGSQLGIDAFTALKDIYWIKGKPSCDASLINSLIKRDHGGDALMPVEATTERCTIKFKRRDWDHYEELTVAAEQYQHLINDSTRVTWKTNRQDMLWARCVSTIGRRHFSDTIKGLYTREEMRDAEATEATYRVVPSAPDVQATAEDTARAEIVRAMSGPAAVRAEPVSAPPGNAPLADAIKRLNEAVKKAFPGAEDAKSIRDDIVCYRYGLDSIRKATVEQRTDAATAVAAWAPSWAPKALEWLRMIAGAETETMLTDVAILLEEQGVDDEFVALALSDALGRCQMAEVDAAVNRAVSA
jgi:hypothetical protein